MNYRIALVLYNAVLAVVFLLCFKAFGIFAATAVLVAGVWAEVIFKYFVTRRVSIVDLTGLVLVTALGGATLLLGDALYIEWRPTAFYWLCAVLFVALWIARRSNPLESLLGMVLKLPPTVWSKLGVIAILLFIGLGAINLYVAYTYSLDTWVNWRVFGAPAVIGLVVLAALAWRHREVRNAYRTALSGRRSRASVLPADEAASSDS